MDSKMRGIVRCELYNEKWKEEFCRIKAMLIECIGDLIINIEHVGSTSVEGLIAKPIIDIDIVFDSCDIFPMISERLKTIGYIHEGDYGIKGREAFKRNFEDEYMPYHLYACPKDSEELLRHISFREYLKVNTSDRETYRNLKMELAKRFPEDIDSYMSGKHDCIQHIYENIKKSGMLFEKYPI
jgi:GrpB-like predicted nucleotidyltransferase (UPF0157 family)